ncbi:MAG: hypothetical protein PUB44_08710, partial [Clostridium sp.]|nr:hypothetical protein [Clostridium sp.]
MTKKKTVLPEILLPAFCLLFYLFLFFLDGVNLSADSQSYIDFTYGREPFYPLFLAFFRLLFGAGFYFKAVVFVQCLLWAVSMYALTKTVCEKVQGGVFSACVLVFFQAAVVFLCRVVAARHATYCNEICSEGIAIPLFTLLLTELSAYSTDYKNSRLITSMLIGALLISTRKQMYIVVLIMGALYF